MAPATARLTCTQMPHHFGMLRLRLENAGCEVQQVEVTDWGGTLDVWVTGPTAVQQVIGRWDGEGVIAVTWQP